MDNKLRESKFDIVSRGFTNIFDLRFPEELNLGKNQVKVFLRESSALQVGSAILFDFIDGNGLALEWEISSIVNTDGSRNLVIVVTDENVSGTCTIYASGVLNAQWNNQTYLYVDEININAQHIVQTQVAFKEQPKVKYAELKKYTKQTNTGNSRLTSLAANGESVFDVVSRQRPRQFFVDNLTFERVESTETLTKTPNLVSSSLLVNTVEIPTGKDFTIVSSTNFEFSASMQGGTIYFNNISLPLPASYTDISQLTGLQYSASILKVINTASIEVYPPLQFNVFYTDLENTLQPYNVDRLYGHSNVTCSYFAPVSTVSIPVTKSFVEFEVGGLEPEYGTLSNINVLWKPVGEVGKYKELGGFSIEKSNANIFVDNVSLDAVQNSNGVIQEKSKGNFQNGLIDFETYWENYNGHVSASRSNSLINGIKVWNGEESTDYAAFNTKGLHLSNKIYRDSDVTVKFEWDLEQPNNAQMDVYSFGFSGIADNVNSIYKPVYYTPSSSLQFVSASTYLGSLTRENKNKISEFKLRSAADGYAGLLFAFRRGKWNLKDIEIYAQNQTRILAPLDNLFVTGSELSFKIDYQSPDGAKSNTTTNLYGVKFDGNQVAPKKDYKPTIFKKSIIAIAEGPFDNLGDEFKLTFDVTQPTDGYSYRDGVSIGYNYNIVFNVVGVTGSINSPIDKYVWAGTYQGRGIMPNPNNPSETILFGQTAVTGSDDVSKLGGFGKPSGSMANLDSWLRVQPVGLTREGHVQVSFMLTSSGSAWQAYAVGEMDLYRYEQKL